MWSLDSCRHLFHPFHVSDAPPDNNTPQTDPDGIRFTTFFWLFLVSVFIFLCSCWPPAQCFSFQQQSKFYPLNQRGGLWSKRARGRQGVWGSHQVANSEHHTVISLHTLQKWKGKGSCHTWMTHLFYLYAETMIITAILQDKSTCLIWNYYYHRLVRVTPVWCFHIPAIFNKLHYNKLGHPFNSHYQWIKLFCTRSAAVGQWTEGKKTWKN